MALARTRFVAMLALEPDFIVIGMAKLLGIELPDPPTKAAALLALNCREFTLVQISVAYSQLDEMYNREKLDKGLE